MKRITNFGILVALALFPLSMCTMGCEKPKAGDPIIFPRVGTVQEVARTTMVTPDPFHQRLGGGQQPYGLGDHVVYMGNLFQIAEDGYIIAMSPRYVKVSMFPQDFKGDVSPCERFMQPATEWMTWDHILEHVAADAR